MSDLEWRASSISCRIFCEALKILKTNHGKRTCSADCSAIHPNSMTGLLRLVLQGHRSTASVFSFLAPSIEIALTIVMVSVGLEKPEAPATSFAAPAEAMPAMPPVAKLTWAEKLKQSTKKPEAGMQKLGTEPVSILKDSKAQSERDLDSRGSMEEQPLPPPPSYPPVAPIHPPPPPPPAYPPPAPVHPPSHYVADSPVASGATDSSPPGDKTLIGQSFDTTQVPASSGRASESEPSSSPHQSREIHFVDDASDEESFRSDSEGDIPEYWDGQDEDEDRVTTEYAKLQEVVAEMRLGLSMTICLVMDIVFAQILGTCWWLCLVSGTSRGMSIALEISKVGWSQGLSASFLDQTSEAAGPKHRSWLTKDRRRLSAQSQPFHVFA